MKPLLKSLVAGACVGALVYLALTHIGSLSSLVPALWSHLMSTLLSAHYS
jgi:hypothetical protein